MADFDLYGYIGDLSLPPPSSLAAAVYSADAKSAVLCAYLLSKKYNKKGIFVADNTCDLGEISSLFAALFGRKQPLIYDREFNFDNVESVSDGGISSAALEQIRSGQFDVVITTVDALCMPLPAPENSTAKTITLSVGDCADLDLICDTLIDFGYSMFDTVEGAGSFSRRGDIVDIFTPSSHSPVRIEFFDTEIERMSYFDIFSQRRTEQCESIKITPINDMAFISAGDMLELLTKENQRHLHPDIERDIEALKNSRHIATDKYIPLVYPKIFTLFDYIDDALIFVNEFSSVKSRCDFIKWQFEQNAQHCIEHGKYLCDGNYYLNYDSLCEYFVKNTYLFSQLPPTASMKLSALTDCKILSASAPRYEGVESAEILQEYISRGYTCIITANDSARVQSIKSTLVDASLAVTTNKITKDAVCILQCGVSLNVVLEVPKILLMSDIASKKKGVKRAKHKIDGEKIKSFDDITEGDLVVHSTHGIGIYKGIKQMTVSGATKDYIVICYDKGDTLYVPCPQLDLISKYVGADTAKVKLTRLGSGSWERAKAKVKNESQILAKELIELYAKRLNAKGFAFSPDTDWQREFEQRFEYEETEDQIQCVREIKHDMERPYPMDRLLCGDVGVGKTEVALRAAFKAVMDGKQVAILVPTTILANQHFNTISERFSGFPVKIAVLSRFKSKKELTNTVKALTNGEVDIVIGTHRLLQKDIVFKDLGLLIVDEEQRFGVKHKEKIKEMAVGVDVLTMSATPIPRTLNMSMSGIRDISIIEEAPSDRLPVMTYVLEYNFDIITQAIVREMRRNGCVFYLKNDIEALDNIATRLSIAIPEARIVTAHGKMSATEIENAWEDVCSHKVDILLCTTIIETGIDVGFANTLIIEDADRMGLAQLHQIRGRVGRSNRRAYAYLTYKKDKNPSEIASKRLITIKEFTEFGAGLKIAMRDLELRGAGSLLGERQHGNMSAVGYDTYMQILKNVILTQQGKEPQIKSDCSIDILISAYIPKTYITSERTRIDIYKKIAAIKNTEGFEDVQDELCDRFKKPPECVINLMRISLIRNMARDLHISDIKQRGDNLVFFFNKLEVQTIETLSRFYGPNMMFTPADKPYITLRPNGKQVIERMQEFLKRLSEI